MSPSAALIAWQILPADSTKLLYSIRGPIYVRGSQQLRGKETQCCEVPIGTLPYLESIRSRGFDESLDNVSDK